MRTSRGTRLEKKTGEEDYNTRVTVIQELNPEDEYIGVDDESLEGRRKMIRTKCFGEPGGSRTNAGSETIPRLRTSNA